MSSEFDITKYVYEKQFECPVCEVAFAAPVARFGKSRIVSQDTDLKQNYEPFDPTAYDVVVCKDCGYAESVTSFEKVLPEKTKEQLLEIVKPDFKGRTYPMELTTEMSLERFYIMLVCNEVKKGNFGIRAYSYLKMAWICRNAEDIRESEYLRQALENFKLALQKETPPIAGMDESAVSYIIGELERRMGNDDEALRWFSTIVSSRGAEGRIKDRARDQKDLIMQGRKKEQAAQEAAETPKAAEAPKSGKPKKFLWS